MKTNWSDFPLLIFRLFSKIKQLCNLSQVKQEQQMQHSKNQGSRKLVFVVSRILDNHGLVRHSGSQTMTNQAWPKAQLGQTIVI